MITGHCYPLRDQNVCSSVDASGLLDMAIQLVTDTKMYIAITTH